MKEKQNFERVTVSIPSSLSKEIDILMKDLNVSKSEVFKLAFEKFSKEYKNDKLKKIAEEMKDEYRTNKKLTEFTSLDGEDFR